tara:strand:- start:1643 stop:2707 length:1065 start_codon:yes stop_codon:yes gene_type:complete
MAINVNTVYTTVLNILNKEQRGYMTPDEFNKVATQVQLEIFENFFHDLNQYLRMPKIDAEFASRVDHIEEEIQSFEEYKSASSHSSGIYSFPKDSDNKNEVYRLGSVYFNAVTGTPQIELVNRREYKEQLMSPLTQPSKKFPIAILKDDAVEVFPKVTTFNPPGSTSNNDVKFSYVRKPKDVRWGYSVNSQGGYLYDSSIPYGLAPSINIITSLTQNATGISDATYSATVGTTSGVTTSGDGSGLVLSIVVSGNTVTNINVGSIGTTGQGFKSGDTITITSTLLTGANQNVVITLTQSDIYVGTRFSQDFEIDSSSQTSAILEILKYSGIIIRDPQIIQAAQQELVQDEANSKR